MTDPAPSAAPPPFEASISAVFAIGVGVPVATGLVWAGPVFALFVMHPDRDEAMQRIGKRIGGTFAGVGAAWLVTAWSPGIAVTVASTVAAAAAMPHAMRRGVFAGTLAGTLFVLLLLDVGLESQGGDRPLIVARLLDTLIGTAAVAIATIALDRWRRRAAAASSPASPSE
ncbi:MAG TPA: FUSC family protein [Casimicrobiaceae bacterium]|nr:FUSC family protein [Casimicrobiaceae bacterium]